MKQFSSGLPILDCSLVEDQLKDSKGISLNRILNKQIEFFTKENNTIIHETKA